MRFHSVGMLAGAVALLVAVPARAQRTDWPLADRTVIGDGSVVLAVAAAIDRVMVCTPTGVLLLDPISRHWTGPFLPPDAGQLASARAGLLDPLDQSLWVQLGGGWLHFEPTIELWESGVAPGPVSQIAFDGDNSSAGLFLLVGASWYLVPRGSGFPVPSSAPKHPIRPLSIPELMSQATGLAGMTGGVLTDPRGRLARFTSAATDPAGRGWWVGTAGVGLVFVPFGQVVPEQVPFGLPSAAAAAVYAAPGEVWIATDQSTGANPALARVSTDLTAVHWNEGPMATGLPFRYVTRLTGADRYLWLGTDAGLLRIGGDGRSVERFDESRGLPDGRVLSVLARRGRVLAGTMHGLVSVDDTGKVTRLAPTFADRIDGIEMLGDTILVGTEQGPLVFNPASGEFEWPNGMDRAPAYRSPVLAMGRLADTLVALTTERLEWRDPASGHWSLGPLLGASLGRLRTMIPWLDGVFVAGDHAVAFVRLLELPARPLTVPIELPAAPRDLAVDDTYLWVATNQGVVRWRLDAIAP
ncbi:MAG TPA: hypothetical protein VJN95_05905 [Gemmatimonadales bacterium]|nr:hypothetical protein [Gemmatimonadales bacterium]